MTSPAIRAPYYAGRFGAAEPVWPLFAVLFASLSIVTGLIWDISWHRSIGRDTFWSPPHVLEQAAAVVAGLTCGAVVLWTTLRGTVGEKGRSVGFWGFRGPLGMFVCIWGTLMMIVSAPFDDWWHNAYGLDVRIISPPHLVLALGMIGIQVGAMLTVLARQNRGAADDRRLAFLYVSSAAILLTMHATVLMEEARFPHLMHAARFYQITSIFFPLALVALALPSRLRWPATTAAAIYMGIDLVIMWVLQLSPAQPLLAPIMNPVTHMVPQPFPLLLVIPAAAIDLLLQRRREGENQWKLAAMIGASFVGLMALTHWFFAQFLLSPAARNIMFGGDNWDYDIKPGPWRYEYWMLDVNAAGEWSPGRLAAGLLVAVLIATISARVGLRLGRGMSRIQR
jgi:hypothetical protein